MARTTEEIVEDLVRLYENVDADQISHVMTVAGRLAESVLKSAASGEDRGDFAKGREQMAMHAIALLVGANNWKEIERILFGGSNGD